MLYQIIFRSSAHIGSIPKIGPTYTLTDSGLTLDNNGNLVIGGVNGLSINGSNGVITFANAQTFPSLSSGSGDVSGTYPNLTVTGLQGHAVANTAPTIGQVLQFNGTQWTPAPPAAPAWLLGGNSGTGCTTSPCSKFLGTTDNTGFEFQVDGQRAYRIEPATENFIASAFAPNTIGGSSGNNVTAGAGGVVIGGGGTASFPNSVTDDFGVVGGGASNRVGNNSGTTSDACCATVAGGLSNAASGTVSTIGGGQVNVASGFASVIAGGEGNHASGIRSAVAGGFHNTASGDYSFAAGNHANSNAHQGAFVWGDNSTLTDVTATVDNQFIARSTGGFQFVTGIDGAGNPDPTKTVSIAPNSGNLSASGNIIATGTIGLGIYLKNDTPTTATWDEACTNPNDIVFSGGAFALFGHVLRESRPTDLKHWRVTCTNLNGGADIACDQAYVICASHVQ